MYSLLVAEWNKGVWNRRRQEGWDLEGILRANLELLEEEEELERWRVEEFRRREEEWRRRRAEEKRAGRRRRKGSWRSRRGGGWRVVGGD